MIIFKLDNINIFNNYSNNTIQLNTKRTSYEHLPRGLSYFTYFWYFGKGSKIENFQQSYSAGRKSERVSKIYFHKSKEGVLHRKVSNILYFLRYVQSILFYYSISRTLMKLTLNKSMLWKLSSSFAGLCSDCPQQNSV